MKRNEVSVSEQESEASRERRDPPGDAETKIVKIDAAGGVVAGSFIPTDRECDPDIPALFLLSSAGDLRGQGARSESGVCGPGWVGLGRTCSAQS